MIPRHPVGKQIGSAVVFFSSISVLVGFVGVNIPFIKMAFVHRQYPCQHRAVKTVGPGINLYISTVVTGTARKTTAAPPAAPTAPMVPASSAAASGSRRHSRFSNQKTQTITVKAEIQKHCSTLSAQAIYEMLFCLIL